MALYMVAAGRAIYRNLVKTHLMNYLLYLCGFLALIHIQITLANQLDPCSVKTNVEFVFVLSDLTFRVPI